MSLLFIVIIHATIWYVLMHLYLSIDVETKGREVCVGPQPWFLNLQIYVLQYSASYHCPLESGRTTLQYTILFEFMYWNAVFRVPPLLYERNLINSWHWGPLLHCFIINTPFCPHFWSSTKTIIGVYMHSNPIML